MFKEAMHQMRTAFILLVLLTVITGLLYPLLVTALAHVFFPWQANGSLIEKDGIDDAVFIQVSYLNLLAETIDEIDKRNQSGLVSILDQFRQKKQDQ